MVKASKDVVEMKFCPKCGGLMVPVKEKDKTVLKCTKCGYTMKYEKQVDYKLKEEVDKKSRVKTTSIVSSEKERVPLSLEEKEQRVEEYYEIVQELIQEEIEGKTEEE